MKKYFKLFFGKFTLIGVLAVLLSCIVNIVWGDIFALEVIADVIATIGVALLLGSIFDFSKNSSEYTDFTVSIIRETIITKDFLKSLTIEEKQQMLEQIVVPSNTQLQECSSINNYYKKATNTFLYMNKKPFKTNVSIHMIAKIENEKIICEGTICYRRYRVTEKYQPIITSFEKEDSVVLNSYILLPDGERYDLCNEADIVEEKDLKAEKISKKYVTKIPEKYNEHPYITMYREVKEIGTEQRIIFNWSSLTACDGLDFELNCAEDLEIKSYKVFDDSKLYDVNVNEKADHISIISSCWLNEYTGFTLEVGKKEEKREDACI